MQVGNKIKKSLQNRNYHFYRQWRLPEPSLAEKNDSFCSVGLLILVPLPPRGLINDQSFMLVYDIV